MTNIVAQEKNLQAIEAALVTNDLSKMSTDQRLSYYKSVCESVGLNYMTQPFAYITLQGKITLYARRDAADQLRKIHGVSIQILERKTENGLYIVSVRAKDKNGRTDEAIGAIPIEGLKSSELANAMLKTETKAKRRVTLSICGLGILDESELDTVRDVAPASNPQIQSQFAKETKEIELQEPEPEPQIQAKETEQPSFDSFVISFGKRMMGKKLTDFSVDDHKGMIGYLEDGSARTGKPIDGPALDYYNIARLYVSVKS